MKNNMVGNSINPISAQPVMSGFNQEKTDKWFGEFMHQLRTHKVMLDTGTASDDLKHIYDLFINKDRLQQTAYIKSTFTHDLTIMALVDYMKEVKKRVGKNLPTLAFNFSESSLLVWAVLKDDDEATQDALIMAEASVNASFEDMRFYVSSTMVEEGDNLPIPPHYEVF